jgi:hypothetical protein
MQNTDLHILQTAIAANNLKPEATGSQTASVPPQATTSRTSEQPTALCTHTIPEFVVMQNTDLYILQIAELYNRGILPPENRLQQSIATFKSISSGASMSGTSMSGSLPTADTTMDSVSNSKLESSESSDSQKKDRNEDLIDSFVKFLSALNDAAVQNKESTDVGYLSHKLEESFRQYLKGLAVKTDGPGQNVVGDRGASNISDNARKMIEGGRLSGIYKSEQKLIGRYGRVAVENSAAVLQTHKMERLRTAQKTMSDAILDLRKENTTIRSSIHDSETLTHSVNEARYLTLLQLHVQTAADLHLAIAAINGVSTT